MKTLFTTPKLSKGKTWYVWFRYDGKQFRYKFDYNRIKDLEEREIEFEQLIVSLKIALKKGWNPNTKQITPATDKGLADGMTLSKALDFALDKRRSKISEKTFACYSGTVRFLKTAIKDLGYGNLMIADTKRIHIKHLMEQVKKTRKWSNIAYNKNLNYLQGILSELLTWYIIESNPAHKQERYPDDNPDREANRPATKEQGYEIRRTLKQLHPDYYNFVLTLFHSGIRPKELKDLRVSMVEMDKRQFRLPSTITKTTKKRIVAITSELFEVLQEMDLHQVPGNYYLFGTFKEQGRAYKNNRKEFVPAPNRLPKNRAGLIWKRIVKDGLGIDVNLYSNKHAGANAMILAGVSPSALKDKFGHSSMFTTEIYATQLKETYRNEIRNSNIKFGE